MAKRVRLDRVPNDKIVRELLEELRSRYPGLHRALVSERNAHMCARVDSLARANPGARILLVVGAAHQEDIAARLRAVGTVDVE
jgi:pheromone shutdown protein TraB